MTDFKRVWIKDYKIHSYESDFTTRASVCALLQFMQESAWNHAEHLQLGFSHLMAKGLGWVLARLALRINAMPHWGDTITIETWPSARDKLFAYRDFRIRAQDGAVLALGSTTWFAMDVKRRRPQRTNSYFQTEQWDAERVLPEFAAKVPPLERTDEQTSHRVYYSHLDVNGHVNNVKYMGYVIDSLPIDFLADHFITSLDLNFLAEALHGDAIDVKTQREDDLVFLHSLQRQNKGDELCRLKTIWKKVQKAHAMSSSP